MNDDDDDFFLDDDDDLSDGDAAPAWKLLIVDDEPDIHNVTRLALHDFSFMGKSVSMLSAHSAQEAKQVMETEDDIALILLDVVMETDHAGLDFARWLRDSAANETTRIILRTGQPGQAPERQVVLAYDINDYKAKSELTSERLFASVVTALRGYHELKENDQLRAELLTRLAEQNEASQALIQILPFPVVEVDVLGQVSGVNGPMASLCGATDILALIGMLASEALPDPVQALLSSSADSSHGRVSVDGQSYVSLMKRISDTKVLLLVPDAKGGE